MEEGDILLHDDRVQGDEPGSTRLGNVTKIWLTKQGELGIKTDLAYSLGIRLTKANIDELRNQLAEIDAKKQAAAERLKAKRAKIETTASESAFSVETKHAEEKDYYTVKELAELLSLATRTIRGRLGRGEIKGIKLAGKGPWRIPSAEVLRLQSHIRHPEDTRGSANDKSKE